MYFINMLHLLSIQHRFHILRYEYEYGIYEVLNEATLIHITGSLTLVTVSSPKLVHRKVYSMCFLLDITNKHLEEHFSSALEAL